MTLTALPCAAFRPFCASSGSLNTIAAQCMPSGLAPILTMPACCRFRQRRSDLPLTGYLHDGLQVCGYSGSILMNQLDYTSNIYTVCRTDGLQTGIVCTDLPPSSVYHGSRCCLSKCKTAYTQKKSRITVHTVIQLL